MRTRTTTDHAAERSASGRNGRTLWVQQARQRCRADHRASMPNGAQWVRPGSGVGCISRPQRRRRGDPRTAELHGPRVAVGDTAPRPDRVSSSSPTGARCAAAGHHRVPGRRRRSLTPDTKPRRLDTSRRRSSPWDGCERHPSHSHECLRTSTSFGCAVTQIARRSIHRPVLSAFLARVSVRCAHGEGDYSLRSWSQGDRRCPFGLPICL
jgi:hypothetical protein